MNSEASSQQTELSRTRFSFIMLAAYFLSQAYLIPIAALGPSWAVWPRFADLAFFGMFTAVALGSRSGAAFSAAQAALLRSLLLVYALCCISYGVMVVVRGEKMAVLDGLQGLARLTQFFLLYWFVSQIPLNAARLRILGFTIDFALGVVCLSVALTYFGIVPLRLLTAHLPQDPGVAGNWSMFARLDKFDDVHKGLGTVGYNHAYTAILILLLLALRLHLLAGSRSLWASVCVLVALGATVLTESRAGLAAFLLFAAVFFLRNPKALLGGLVLALIVVARMDWRKIESTLDRHKTIVSTVSDDNLSGRPLIWGNHLRSLRDHPLRVIIGGGFGSARVNGRGSDGHMLYLQILSEGGMLGLVLFLALALQVLISLYRYEGPGRPIFWVTLALLLSSFTQETFYPLPAMGHFLGLYLAALALALRRPYAEA
ncbi:MAG: O-antigen ligase family protein [Deltaproteobacteria bacterium]|nr:O-antigen ligase family protein [Deltaproteobacteria bacterium]